MTTLTVHEVGWRTTFQDLGRVATERLGVPRGGAADQAAARVATVLVGNPSGSPLIESLGGAVAFEADADILVSATGSVDGISIDGCDIELGQPLAVPAGAVVRIRTAETAARTYVAVGGILDAPRFLGSVAPDQRMGFTQTIAAGDRLGVASAVDRIDHPHLGRALFRLPLPARLAPGRGEPVRILDCAGTDEIDGIRELLASSAYTVTNQSDHVGIRLDGPVLHPVGAGEILSHGVPIGAIEIPHSDELIVLGRYRTLTAGYPIVGFATRRSQDLIGQLRPGHEVEFAWTDRAQARAEVVRFEMELAALTAASLSAFSSLGLPVAAIARARQE